MDDASPTPEDHAAVRGRGTRTRRAVLVAAGPITALLATVCIAWGIVQVTTPANAPSPAARTATATATHTPKTAEAAAHGMRTGCSAVRSPGPESERVAPE